MGSFNLSFFEVVILFFSAIVIGFVIQLFISSRKKMKTDLNASSKSASSGLDEWKLKYINDAEIKDKEIADLKNRVLEATENKRIHEIEIEELKSQVRKLNLDVQQAKKE